MAVLITGATGHLGPHLIAELLRASDFDRLYVAARRTGEPAASRVQEVERIARASLAASGCARNFPAIVPVEADFVQGHPAIARADLRRIGGEVEVIVHAAADTRFGAPLEALKTANVGGTLTACRTAERCRRLRQFLFVSTACVAGRRTGRIPETIVNDPAGFANAYERSKWEAEAVVVSSGLPCRIARLSTCAGSHVNGYVHRFGALHHLLHWISRGLVPMVPGSAATPIDVISTDVAAAWLAQAVRTDPKAVEICHVALGERAIPLQALLDLVIPLLDEDGRGRVRRPALVAKPVFESFSRMVTSSGDALLARVQASAAAVLPSLLHPKTYETSAAERCFGGPLPHPDTATLLSRVIEFGSVQRWGIAPAPGAAVSGALINEVANA
jgi:nucleoside-diphosphate-sugar epimerase